jgi:ribonuclease P protein component
MLSKKERLTRDEFNQFFTRGRRFHSPSLQIIFSPHDTFHAAVVVSKKVSKLAVKRNKLRRRIYDIVRRYRLGVAFCGVCIVMVKPSARQLSFSALTDEVTVLLDEISKKYQH